MKCKSVISAILIYFGFACQISAQAVNSNFIPVEFNKLVHDFGDIQLNSGKHTYTFTFKNISKEPVLIQTVISSCGCTSPVWTKNPIKPGSSGKIEVTYLNDQGPYPFDKSLTVYITNSNKPIVLRIKGIVHDKPKSVKQLFPESIGAAGFRKLNFNIGQIAQGSSKVDITEVANLSSRPASIGFTNITPGLKISVTPQKVAPGKTAEVRVEIDTKGSKNWGQTIYSAEITVDGQVQKGKKLIIEASIRDNFAALSKEQIDNAPLPMATFSTYDFDFKKKGEKIICDFEIKNLGRRDLLIYKVDYSEKGISAKYPSTIKPGANGKISVVVDSTGDVGEKAYILTLITNSPARPAMNLVLSGIIK